MFQIHQTGFKFISFEEFDNEKKYIIFRKRRYEQINDFKLFFFEMLEFVEKDLN